MSTVSNGPLFRSRGTGTQERKEPVGRPPPAHTLGALELNTYPQPCEELFSSYSHFAHHFVSTVANWCRTEDLAVEAELSQERSERRPQGTLGAVLDLDREGEAVRGGRAEERFRPAFRDPARERLHQVGVGGSRAADQLGVRTHRSGDPPVDAAEGDRDPRQGQREGDDAAAVDSGLGLIRTGEARDFRELCLLAWMVGQAIALGRPSFRAAEREHPGVLAGAVVPQLRALERPAFERSAWTASSCWASARCDADAIARSLSSRSSRARASGRAWIGFAAERMN